LQRERRERERDLFYCDLLFFSNVEFMRFF
jgi:hypothetical protein